MKGVSFVNVDTGNVYHSMADFGMYLYNHPLKNPAAPKWLITDIPGTNGEINYTKAFTGRVNYANRTIHMDLMTIEPVERWDYLYSEVQDALNGVHMHIVFDSDPGYYYDAWTYVSSHRPERHRQIISVDANAYPYKFEMFSSLDDWLWDPFSFEDGIIREYKNLTVDEVLQVRIPGRRMEVVPTITVNSTGGSGMTVSYKGKTYSLPDGTSRVVEIDLQEGESVLTFRGYGTVTIGYRGGRF